MRSVLFLLLLSTFTFHAFSEEKVDQVLAKVNFDSANAMLKNGNRVDDAIRFLGNAIKADPSYKEALVLRANLYVQRAKFDEARADYRKVLDIFEQYKRALTKDEQELLDNAKRGWEMTDVIGRAFEQAQKTLRDAAETVQATDKKGAALLREAAGKVQETAEARGKEQNEAPKVDPIIGRWTWFNGVATFNADGTCSYVDPNPQWNNNGKWEWEKEKRRYAIFWKTGINMVQMNTDTALKWLSADPDPNAHRLR